MADNTFVYKESDKEGFETLKTISASRHFNQWMYESIQPFLKGNVLEIGSGIGNITEFAIRDNLRITASDIREGYCDILRNRFKGTEKTLEIVKIDIVHPDFDIIYRSLFEKFDAIFALNIVEHVQNDALAVQNCRKLLKTGGNLIILVPAYPKLYNNFDKELKHFRRYNSQELQHVLTKNGFTIYRSKYFNFAGILGWWLNGSIFKKKIIPEKQMQLFDFLVPFFRLIDKMICNKAGLSVIAVAIRNTSLSRMGNSL
jgi:SAM-dependent methyltransferase